MTMDDPKTLSARTLKNFGYSFFGYIFPLVFTILITPIIVHRLGVRDYGILLLTATIMGFLNLMDFGVGMAIVKKMAEYVAKQDLLGQRRLLGSAYTIFFILGLVGFLIFLVLGLVGLNWFHVAADQHAYVLKAFIYSGLAYVATSVSLVAVYVLKSLQRYDITVSMGLVQNIVASLVSLLLVVQGFGLQALLISNMIIATVCMVVYSWRLTHILPHYSFHFSWDSMEIKSSFRYGIQFFITNLSNNTLAQFDRLIIPLYLSPVQLSYYSLPGNVAEKINGVGSSTTSVLFPLMSSLQGVSSIEKAKVVYTRVMRNMLVITLAMAVPLALFADPLLRFWLGPQFAEQGARVLVLLVGTNFFLALYGVLQNFLSGYGYISQLMKWSCAMAVLNVGLLLIAVPRYGITGAAWAYLFAVLPVIGCIVWTEQRILKLPHRARFYIQFICKAVCTSAVFWVVYHWGLAPLLNGLVEVVVLGPLAVLIFLGLYKVFGFFEQEDSLLVKNYILSFIKRY